MIAMACPTCTEPMQVDENEANIEWECPSCEAAFVIRGVAGGEIHYVMTDVGGRKPPRQTATTGQPQQTSRPQESKINDEAYLYALECLLKGTKPRDVRKSLLESGHSAKQADQILETAIKFQKTNENKEKMMDGSGGNTGQRNMVIGGIVCLIGIVITLGTMSAAMQSGGGQYIIAWGAVVFGGFQFFRGWMQSKHS